MASGPRGVFLLQIASSSRASPAFRFTLHRLNRRKAKTPFRSAIQLVQKPSLYCQALRALSRIGPGKRCKRTGAGAVRSRIRPGRISSRSPAGFRIIGSRPTWSVTRCAAARFSGPRAVGRAFRSARTHQPKQKSWLKRKTRRSSPRRRPRSPPRRNVRRSARRRAAGGAEAQHGRQPRAAPVYLRAAPRKSPCPSTRGGPARPAPSPQPGLTSTVRTPSGRGHVRRCPSVPVP